MEKICRGCGKPFRVAKGNQSYCTVECQSVNGKSNRAKPSGWTFHGKCFQCGELFESKRIRKYCSDACQKQFQLDKAKIERLQAKPLCKQCGKQLPLKRHTFCSDDCQQLAEKKTDIIFTPLTEETVRRRIAEQYDHIEHVSGHSSGGVLIVRCKVCRGEFSITEQSSRKIRKLPCPRCAETKKLLENETAEHNRLINRLAFLLEKRQKSICDMESRKKCCVICEKEFIPQHGNALVCSESCKQKQQNLSKRKHRHTRKVLKKCNGEIDHSISLEQLAKRDKNVCHICGRKCDKRDFVVDAMGNFIVGSNYPSIDHVTPLSKGGSHTWNNVKLAHFDCNRIKSDALCFVKPNGQIAMAM